VVQAIYSLMSRTLGYALWYAKANRFRRDCERRQHMFADWKYVQLASAWILWKGIWVN